MSGSGAVMAELFISYRRGDPIARALRDYLEENLYPGATYFDTTDLVGGAYQPQLDDATRGCQVVLLVITRMWTLRADELTQDDDPVRREIRTAQTVGAVLIPIIASNLRPEELPLPDEFRDLRALEAVPCPLLANEPAPLRHEHVPGLLQRVRPHLTRYWRVRCEYWQVRLRRAVGVAVALAAALLPAVALGYLVRRPEPTPVPVPEPVEVRERFVGPLAPKVAKLRAYLDALPQPLFGADGGDRDRRQLDGWLQNQNDLADRLNEQANKEAGNKTGQLQPFAMYLATRTFDRRYQHFAVEVKVPPGRYTVSQVFAFLKSDAGKQGSYRPVYRQLKAEYDDGVPPDFRRIEIESPNPGDELFVLLLVFQKNPSAPWPDGGALDVTFKIL